jgi:hypothetical protein
MMSESTVMEKARSMVMVTIGINGSESNQTHPTTQAGRML